MVIMLYSITSAQGFSLVFMIIMAATGTKARIPGAWPVTPGPSRGMFAPKRFAGMRVAQIVRNIAVSAVPIRSRQAGRLCYSGSASALAVLSETRRLDPPSPSGLYARRAGSREASAWRAERGGYKENAKRYAQEF
jgi:hypothetical protein